jgi:hypothetical protein
MLRLDDESPQIIPTGTDADVSAINRQESVWSLKGILSGGGDRGRLVRAVLLGLAIAVLYLIFDPYTFAWDDWNVTYRSVARFLIEGRNPYLLNRDYFNPPWAMIPVIPAAFMPDPIARIYGALLACGALGYVMYRLKASLLSMLLIFSSMPVVLLLHNGQIDFLVLLGWMMPRPLGMLLLVIKPQVGAVMGLLWIVEAYQDGGWRGVVKLVWPVTAAYLVSFVAYGPWILVMRRAPGFEWNLGLFPYLLPVGLLLVWLAIRKHDELHSLRASPLIAPYCSPVNLVGLMVSFVQDTRILLLAWIVSWIALGILL